jgi:hypothetical protein
MKLEPSSDPSTLVKITVDQEGLRTMIKAAICAIRYGEDWNFGDEYDLDLTPYHDMRDRLIEKYKEVYSDENFTI